MLGSVGAMKQTIKCNDCDKEVKIPNDMGITRWVYDNKWRLLFEGNPIDEVKFICPRCVETGFNSLKYKKIGADK